MYFEFVFFMSSVLKYVHTSLQDLHGFFPQLLGSIFGYTGCVDWGLRNTYINSSDAQVLHQFLSPYGPLFKLIDKLQADGFLRYEFFVQCLPVSDIFKKVILFNSS